MWRIPVSLLGGGGVVDLDITSDTYIGDLWIYLGSPSGPAFVTLQVDNADVAEIYIPSDFAAGSTFEFTAINGGRFIGPGGNGGSGGDDDGASGDPGNNGLSGGHAIRSNGFNVDVNIDDGFMLGGGGGAGGGSYDDTGVGGTPGGGGGGGVGWGDAAGGAAGDPTGSPVATAGSAGSQISAGAGGAGGSSGTNNGGAGGGWGLAGDSGQSANPCVDDFVFGVCQGNGGSGGDGGSAFNSQNGSVVTFTGAKSEATLRIENRVKGETTGNIGLVDLFISGNHVGGGHPSRTYGYLFNTDGTITLRNTDTGDSSSGWWSGQTVTAADYELRYTSITKSGAWDTEASSGDAWISMSVQRSYTYATADTSHEAGMVFEIRRTDETLPCASGHLMANTLWEP